MKIKSKSYLIRICVVLFLLALAGIQIIAADYTTELNVKMAYLLIVLSFWALAIVKSNMFLFIVYFFLFYSNYSITVAIYIYPELKPWMYGQISDAYTLGKGLLMLVVFMLIQLLFIPEKIQETKGLNLEFSQELNRIFVWGIIAILCFICVFSFARPTETGVRGSPSTYYEYSILLFALGFYYSGKSMRLRYVLFAVLLTYAAQNFIFGGRVTAIKLLLFVFLFYYYNKFDWKQIFPIIVGAVFAMIAIGQFRTYWLTQSDLVSLVMADIKAEYLTFDTAYWAYFPSLTFIRLRDQIFSWSECFDLFLNFLSSIFLGSRATNWSLPIVSREYFTHWNGGVYPQYGYTWLGWFGVFATACVPAGYTRLINNIHQESGDFKKLLVPYISACVPRWYLYSNNDLIRGVLILFVFYQITRFVKRMILIRA